MKTKIIKITSLARDLDKIRYVADVIKDGGLAVLPTETVYGIAANALDPAAVSRIFEAKGRPHDNPLIVHIADLSDIDSLVSDFPKNAKKLAEKFWPGPLTIILNKTNAIPDTVSAGLNTVAIRMPLHPIIRAVIGQSGVPLAAPSANISGKPSPTNSQHCIEDLFGKVDIIVDGGLCDIGIESTVISCAALPPKVLRPGMITLEQLEAVIGEVSFDKSVTSSIPLARRASSPGMKYKHYSPDTKIILLHASFKKFANFVSNKAGAAALVFDGEEKNLMIPCVSYGVMGDAFTQSKRLFSALRELDRLGVQTVYARVPELSGAGFAVYNRLLRAAGFDEIYL
ncbi:MAG: L-threonylcarbamoyladenylate synthase [Oscillospiraceae bacterium]|nr:L-threonylcarbamoyladenylate synthase [Oscillospiraceae bacterium]